MKNVQIFEVFLRLKKAAEFLNACQTLTNKPNFYNPFKLLQASQTARSL